MSDELDADIFGDPKILTEALKEAQKEYFRDCWGAEILSQDNQVLANGTLLYERLPSGCLSFQPNGQAPQDSQLQQAHTLRLERGGETKEFRISQVVVDSAHRPAPHLRVFLCE